MNKNNTKKLQQLIKAVIEEAECNPVFSQKLDSILSDADSLQESKSKKEKEQSQKRATNRRDPAVLDPVAMITQNEPLLVQELNRLTDKELKDIIADYGMDPSRLAMKWKDKDRLINHILESARRKSSKGDAFRTTD